MAWVKKKFLKITLDKSHFITGVVIIYSFIGIHRKSIGLLIRVVGLVFICTGYFVNFQYIDDHYEVETALEMEQVYEQKTGATAHNEYEIQEMNLFLIEKIRRLSIRLNLR